MKLSEHVYQLTGKGFGINSNVYGINTEKGIVIIDAGYAEKQFIKIEETLRYWGFSIENVKDVILTHCHFDHVGNAHKFKELGKRILMGEKDINAVETGNSYVIEKLFKTPFTPFKVDVSLENGDILDYGDIQLKVIDQEGHTKGAIALLLESKSEKILFIGDSFEILTVTPDEEIKIVNGWMDGEDFNGKKYLETLKNIYDMDFQIICMGHGSPYYGDSKDILHRVYKMAKEKLRL